MTAKNMQIETIYCPSFVAVVFNVWKYMKIELKMKHAFVKHWLMLILNGSQNLFYWKWQKRKNCDFFIEVYHKFPEKGNYTKWSFAATSLCLQPTAKRHFDIIPGFSMSNYLATIVNIMNECPSVCYSDKWSYNKYRTYYCAVYTI